jgi:hypothetical protein
MERKDERDDAARRKSRDDERHNSPTPTPGQAEGSEETVDEALRHDGERRGGEGRD